MAQRDELGGSATTGGREQAGDLARQARESTRRQVDDLVGGLITGGRDQASRRLATVASALGDVAQRLEREDPAGLGGWARRVADQATRAAKYFRERDLDELVHDSRTFARRHPDLFLSGSLLAGVLLARLVKRSAGRIDGGAARPGDRG